MAATTNKSRTRSKSPEYKAFKKLYAYMKETLDPGTLASEAYSCSLLTSSERNAATIKTHPEEDRMEALLNAVEKRIRAEPGKFHVFLEALEEEDAFEDVASRLRSTYGEYVSAKVNPTAQTIPAPAACVGGEVQRSGSNHQSKATPTAVRREEGGSGAQGNTNPPPYARPSSRQRTDRILVDRDHFDITEYLLPLVDDSDIHQLGTVLGLYHDRLKVIQRNSYSFLDDMVWAWLRREGDVDKRGGPRWSTLADALRHPRLKQTRIADQIESDKGLAS